MFFKEAKLHGSFIIELQKLEDERGFFARAWCQREFENHGIDVAWVQANLAYTRYQGTLRGLHYQVAPHAEAKLVRCIKGAVFDVSVDLRSGSSTYKQWSGVELSANNHKMVYIPAGCAHGYQALTDEVELFYQVSQFYDSDSERGIRYNDPAFGLEWPLNVEVISDKDKSWPDYIA